MLPGYEPTGPHHLPIPLHLALQQRRHALRLVGGLQAATDAAGVGAVSYTHLDVYKRQVMNADMI